MKQIYYVIQALIHGRSSNIPKIRKQSQWQSQLQ